MSKNISTLGENRHHGLSGTGEYMRWVFEGPSATMKPDSPSSEANGLMGIGVHSLGSRCGEGAELVCVGMGEGAESRLY